MFPLKEPPLFYCIPCDLFTTTMLKIHQIIEFFLFFEYVQKYEKPYFTFIIKNMNFMTHHKYKENVKYYVLE